MKYKAVIFDLDGTLLDTIQDISDSVNAVLRENKYHEFSVDDYKYFVGRGVNELIASVIEKGEIDPLEYPNIKNGYMKEYKIRQRIKTRIYPGIFDLIVELQNLEISVNILSNKPDNQTQEVVEHYFKKIRFNNVYGKKPEFRIKPYPESVLHLINKLKVTKDEVLYVGDTNTDIQTARNAGLKSVGVLWGFRKREELELEGATFIVENPMDILKIILGE
ncbi:MAG: HAD family hydrolase [Tenericutes bacterium]|nr:HAD family hydrolase [Mycoplasmatota bacterium]